MPSGNPLVGYPASVLRQPQDGDLPQEGGSPRQSQAGAAPDATAWAGWHGAGPERQSTAPRSTKYTPTCCAALPWSGQTNYGARILHTSDCCAASPTWSQSLTGTRAGYSAGESATAWKRSSVLDALRHHDTPEIFNSDQGSQFTSAAFTEVLKREGVTISMDGRGRAFDNIFVERLWRSVKHEDVYLKGYASMGELLVGLADYFAFYNGERPHQSLANKTPDVVYRSTIGGGAMIVDSSTANARAEGTTTSKATATSEAKPGQRRPAASAVECTAKTDCITVLTQGTTLRRISL